MAASPAVLESPLTIPARPTLAPGVVAVGLILAVAAANVGYLFVCPLDLAPDEAHYWDWSRRPLQWSYYSKGPLVAWLVRASCEAFGTSAPAVRFPAVVCNALLLLAAHRLSRQSFRSDTLALATVALALTVPALAAPAVVMTIDGPFLCCWAWAAVFAQRRAWAAAGVVAAVGVLAKYTMLLFPVCVGLYLLADRDRRRELARPGFWVMVGLAGLGCVPIVGWNAAHDWVGLRHAAAHAGTAPGIDPAALPYFLAGQAVLLLGYWLAAWAAAVVAFRRAGPRVAFLWWLSVPVWLLFLAAGARDKGQPNWAAAAYVTGFVLAVGWVARQVAHPHSAWRKWCQGCLAVAVVLGLVITGAARFPGPVRPLLAELVPAPTAERPVPLRKLDPTSRLSGWRELARVVDGVRAKVRMEEGREPVLATMTWTMPGELAFYCDGHPIVYTLGLALADRHSQYDLWRPNPVADAQAFRGRTFVYVGDAPRELQQAFDRADPPVEVIASDGGVPVADWKVWVLRGFKGFPDGRREAGY